MERGKSAVESMAIEKDCQKFDKVVVREKSKKLQALQSLSNVEIVECNLEHYGQLEKLVKERGFDAFFHFAWQGVVDKDAQDLHVQMDNVKYACDAVHAAKELACHRFIFVSSIMEYEVMKLMETELDSDKRNIYRTAKITSMLNGVRTSFTEAKQLYDFIYINDAVEMLMLIAESGHRNKNYYIGSMEPRILREFIYDMRDCVDPSIEVGIGEYKEFVGVSLTYQEIDIKSCYNDFGFVPRYSFKDGIRKTIEWLNEQT